MIGRYALRRATPAHPVAKGDSPVAQGDSQRRGREPVEGPEPAPPAAHPEPVVGPAPSVHPEPVLSPAEGPVEGRTERIDIADETLAALAHAAGGDARIALNALELAVQSAAPVGAPLAAPAGTAPSRRS
ncbi:MAG: hypothetical protein Q7R32_01185, partial [Dehalococcoidia bacterium]|nr:hypothetical protein [Dehalococcoidia bacterium]